MNLSTKFVTSIKELKNYMNISEVEEEELNKIIKEYPMSITQYYLSLINKEDKNDPIRKMSIPSVLEGSMLGEFDTSGEQENTKLQGLQHKYQKTALILSTNSCAMYCRYCFRKRMVGTSEKEIISALNDAVDYIIKHKEINNVLITGGDSFFLSTKIIEEFLEKLDKIEHLKFIRFGTRVPVVWPERIINDKKLSEVLKKYSRIDRKIYVVTQFNHPRELTKEAIEALEILQESNVILRNQSVLLQGVNAEPEILAKLLNKLVAIGVTPYYIFQCRPVKGVKGHFQISLEEGEKIVRETRKHLNGLSKQFRYIMSHQTGKIEILGVTEGQMVFKYHQSKENEGDIFMKNISKTAGWLDDFN